MKQILRIITTLSVALGVHIMNASNPSKHEIQQNKTATAAGRDLLTTSNIQNNTETNTETQVLTAVVSIVAINGGNYGNIDITQTGGSQTIGTGAMGGRMDSTVHAGTGKGGKTAPITFSGADSASQSENSGNQN